MVEHVPTMNESWGSISSTGRKKKHSLITNLRIKWSNSFANLKHIGVLIDKCVATLTKKSLEISEYQKIKKNSKE